MRDDGLLVLTSRNWEKVRAEAADSEQVVDRDGTRAYIRHRWHIPDGWDERHHMDVEVVLPGATHAERLHFWPFTHEALDDDLRAAGLTPVTSSYDAGVERYMVTATPASSRSS